jgi:hypothetical protein
MTWCCRHRAGNMKRCSRTRAEARTRNCIDTLALEVSPLQALQFLLSFIHHSRPEPFSH